MNFCDARERLLIPSPIISRNAVMGIQSRAYSCGAHPYNGDSRGKLHKEWLVYVHMGEYKGVLPKLRSLANIHFDCLSLFFDILCAVCLVLHLSETHYY